MGGRTEEEVRRRESTGRRPSQKPNLRCSGDSATFSRLVNGGSASMMASFLASRNRRWHAASLELFGNPVRTLGGR